MVLLSSLPSRCLMCCCVHYNAFGNPEICTGLRSGPEMGMTEAGPFVHTHRPGCFLPKMILWLWSWAMNGYQLQSHTLLISGLLHEMPKPAGKALLSSQWLLLLGLSFFFPASRFQPQLLQPILQIWVSFEASHSEGPMSPQKNDLVSLKMMPTKDS